MSRDENLKAGSKLLQLAKGYVEAGDEVRAIRRCLTAIAVIRTAGRQRLEEEGKGSEPTTNASFS